MSDEKTLNEWLHEIAFVTSTMSDPDELQSFQESWLDPDRLFTWSSRRCRTWVYGDM